MSKITFEPQPITRTARERAKAAVQYAAEKAQERAGKADPARHLANFDGIDLIREEGLAYMTVLVDRPGATIWLSMDTFETCAEQESEAEEAFFEGINTWSSGMRYLMKEYPFAEAAKRRAPRVGVPPQGPDVVSLLEEDAKALLVSVATAEGEFSELQMRLFAERLADVRGRQRALAEQMERLEGYLELASVALVDHA